MDPLVPLLIPEINPDHLALSGAAARARLAGRHRDESELFDRRALDGACAAEAVRDPVRDGDDAAGGLGGRLSGRASLDIIGNVIPASAAKKKKSSASPRRFSARCKATGRRHTAVISAQTTRVPVIDGHTTVSIAFERE